MTPLPAGRLAVIADIHGNSDALAAVLADVDRQGVAAVLNLGDSFSGPLAAGETWEILASRPMPGVRGNHDRALIDRPVAAMGGWERPAIAELPAAALDWIAALPVSLDFGTVFACHARPEDDSSYWTEEVRADGTLGLRPQAAIEAEAAGLAQPLLLCAHSHVPRLLRLAGRRVLVNPGSVGCQAYADLRGVPYRSETGSPEARYALLDPGAEGWAVSHRAVPYDPSRMIALAKRNGMPDWVPALRDGRAAG